MKTKQKETIALEILKSTGLDILEAAILAKEALRAGKGKLRRAHKCISMGEITLEKQEKTVTFSQAVQEALKTRKDRRKRTITDFRYICNRLIKRCKGLANKRIRNITAIQCKEYIETAFDTPRQRMKAKLILAGVFSTSQKRGWCNNNPISNMDTIIVQERRIAILKKDEIKSLLKEAERYNNGSCLAAIGLMLYAGIRPHEVTKIKWAQIDLERRHIYLLPEHSKTGGARRTTIYNPLFQILKKCNYDHDKAICPRNWLKHWREIRRNAGWGQNKPWPQDALRHTFASYHLEQFKNFEQLQYELGHRNSNLLRTRYVDATDVKNAAEFWGLQ